MMNDVLRTFEELGIADAIDESTRNKFIESIIKISRDNDGNLGEVLEDIDVPYCRWCGKYSVALDEDGYCEKCHSL
jgi:hypothetical protein